MKTDFNIIHVKKERVEGSFAQPEYILVIEDSVLVNACARIAIKYFPKCKVVTVNRGNIEHIYQMFMNHLTELQRVYESLNDEESKRTFYGYWLGCISSQFGELVHSKDAHYLTAGFIPKPGSIIIDGGAYDGGTATIFSNMGYKVYAFELDKLNFEKAKKVAEEKKFVVENMGLGAYKKEMRYVPQRAGSHVTSQGSEKAQITTIDAYVTENNLPSVDFIKLDVEGAELEVLKGARTTISRWKPILAISAYHKWDDFWILMDYVKSIRSDYEFAIRHYALSMEDEPTTFSKNVADSLNSLGLEPLFKIWWECCLMAR